MSYASLEEAMTVGHGIEREFVCPVHESNNAHASVNSVTGWWYCYSCHASGHVDMTRIVTDPFLVKRSVEAAFAKMSLREPAYAEAWLNVYDAAGPGDYWLSRFDADTCRHFRLGQGANGSYAVTPMRNNAGTVIGIIRRDLTGTDKAKYRYPPGVTVGNYLFDLHRRTGPVLLVTEGATDAIACREAGADVAVATYGSSITRAQVRQIHRYAPRKIICGYDQDAAGESGYAKLRDALASCYPVQRMWWEEYKDLASIPVPQRAEMLRSVLPKPLVIRVAQGAITGVR